MIAVGVAVSLGLRWAGAPAWVGLGVTFGIGWSTAKLIFNILHDEESK